MAQLSTLPQADIYKTLRPVDLPDHPLWKQRVEFLSRDERVKLAYERAKLLVNAYREFNPVWT